MYRAGILLVCLCAVYADEDNPITQAEPDHTPQGDPPATWYPPLYFESLKNIEDAFGLLRSHFTPDGLNDPNSVKFQYAVLIGIINYVTKEIAYTKAESNTNYTSSIRKYTQEVGLDPGKAINKTECAVFKATERAIQEVKEIIKSPPVQFVCKAEPASCNAVIWALLQRSQSSTITYSTNVLLSAGNAANIFLSYYAAAFEIIAKQNVYFYLIHAPEDFNPFLIINAHARIILNPNGDPAECDP